MQTGPNLRGSFQKRDWQPYETNGGTVVAVGQPGFCVVACDSRLSRGYSILSRNQSKITRLTDTCVIATGGMQADRCELHTMLQLNMKEYELEHGHQMSVHAIAQMLSNTLYYRRFFPYYCFNLLAGVDPDGNGVVYGYDAIGSYKEDGYGANGSGKEMITSMLDLAIERKHDTSHKQKPVLNLEEAQNVIKASINACTERDIETGDDLLMYTITMEGGVNMERFPMRRD